MKKQKGQLLVEVLFAIALTSIILPALLTGLITSKNGPAQQKQRIRAIALLKEAEEVVRNVKDQSWNNIATDGTYHPVIANSTWTLSSGSETVNGITRTITISSVRRDSNGSIVENGSTIDPSTKKVVINLNWTQPYNSEAETTLYLTRYSQNASNLQTSVADFNVGSHINTATSNNGGGEVQLGAGGGGGDWCNPTLLITSVDLTRQGVPTAVSAYDNGADLTVVTGTGGNASGPTFVKTLLTSGASPSATFKGEFDNSKANGVFADGNYGFIATTSNSEEIQILDLTQYSNPPTNTKYSKVGSFNAPGNTQGDSIFVSGIKGYMAAADKFYIFDLSSHTGSRTQLNPTAVTLSGTGKKINVVGNYAYVVTNATSNQLQIIDVTTPASASIAASLTLGSQAGVDLSMNSSGTRAYVVTNYSATQQELYIVNTTNKFAPVTITGTGFNTSGMTPKGVSVVTGNRVIIVGTGGTYQYEVVDISTETSPGLCGNGHLAISGGAYAVSSVLQQSNGYAYSYIATGDSSKELKVVLGGAGGQFAYNGTFTSKAFDASHSAAFNYFDPVFVEPAGTTLQFRVAVADAVNNSCTNVNYTFVGPDGTTNTYFDNAGPIPYVTTGNYTNPGRCFKYQAYFTTTDYTATPILYDVSVNYSP